MPDSPEAEYITHGDPYSDPPRARECTTCGALVANEALHSMFHAAIEESLTLGATVLSELTPAPKPSRPMGAWE